MKYVATVILAFGLLILGWGGYGVLRPSLQRSTQESPFVADAGATSGLHQQATEAESVLKKLSSLQALMQPSALPLTLIAQVPPGKNAPVKSPYPVRELSLVYYGDDYRRVVLDGLMFAVGDALPSGGKLLEVKEDRVVIKERVGVRSIAVPGDRLRIGTVHSSKPVR
ncbi:hypothetical protein Q9Q94_03485 [Uliginosibacterium sp. 31-16]|uniref:hypothetical protein n=1 Tax=Uliginosibacterium sp. 31-16 TaxID=3068315 RepID=UPI00273FC4BD|nr:hypothetical protein [Uliginosibacterium sp. 31-16]MDP5238574.1 hypothetical protein [Uliginosibacterium sp. 31-16]